MVAAPTTPDIERRLSHKLRLVSCVCVVMVLAMHAKSIHWAGHWATGHPTGEPLWSNTYAQEWLCTALLRSAMPLLSIISGFLFFSGEANGRWRWQKLRARFWTLMVPFVLWSTSLALLHLAAQLAGLSPLLHRAMSPTAEGIFVDIFVHPVNRPTYFLRDLMIVVLLTPLISLALSSRVSSALLLALVGAVWWLYLPRVPNFQILPFFCLGGVFASYRRQAWLDALRRRFRRRRTFIGWAAAWLSLSLLGTFLQFRSGGVVNTDLQKLTLLAGLPVLWFAFDHVHLRGKLARWLDFVTGYTFVLFAAHWPFVNSSRKLMSWALPHSSEWWGLAVFALTTVLAISATLAFAVMFERFTPTLFCLATGGRSKRARERERSAATLVSV